MTDFLHYMPGGTLARYSDEARFCSVSTKSATTASDKPLSKMERTLDYIVPAVPGRQHPPRPAAPSLKPQAVIKNGQTTGMLTASILVQTANSNSSLGNYE
jgi:hypothetical protein